MIYRKFDTNLQGKFTLQYLLFSSIMPHVCHEAKSSHKIVVQIRRRFYAHSKVLFTSFDNDEAIINFPSIGLGLIGMQVKINKSLRGYFMKTEVYIHQKNFIYIYRLIDLFNDERGLLEGLQII